MNSFLLFTVLALPTSYAKSVRGTQESEVSCGPSGTITIAGASTVLPVTERWAESFSSFCSDTIFNVESGGSSNGASRVCNTGEAGDEVQIGNMAREWKDSEADTKNGWLYECKMGDTSRNTIQFEVAIDGVSVGVKSGGEADECVSKLGGLTMDQLRWIFSDWSEKKLSKDGWDPDSVPNSDGDDSTHLWSELHDSCSTDEIVIMGPTDNHGTYQTFTGEILTEGEPIRGSYEGEEDMMKVIKTIKKDDAAIGYFGYLFSDDEEIVLTPLENEKGDFVSPSQETLEDASYPFTRRIFMNVLQSSLETTGPFVEFGMSDTGSALVAEVGYVPIPNKDRKNMIERIEDSL